MQSDVSDKPHSLTVARRRAAEWVTYRERGSKTLLRIMTFLSLRCGRRISRMLLYLIAAYFFVFAPTVRTHARAYLRCVLGREPTAADRFRHLLCFATTIHDRLYLLKGRFDLFDICIAGADCVSEALQSGQGAFLMGSHLGSFEVIHSVGRTQPGLKVAMAMYEDNARKVNHLLAALNPAALPEVIPLGHMDAMLRIHEDLDRGMFVGMLADRTLGSEAARQVMFLGAPARFPSGPMRAAALMRRPVIFMAGLYCGGNQYRVIFEQLADFSQLAPAQREAAIDAAIDRYAARLEHYCRAAPFNWFNFFDFWRN